MSLFNKQALTGFFPFGFKWQCDSKENMSTNCSKLYFFGLKLMLVMLVSSSCWLSIFSRWQHDSIIVMSWLMSLSCCFDWQVWWWIVILSIITSDNTLWLHHCPFSRSGGQINLVSRYRCLCHVCCQRSVTFYLTVCVPILSSLKTNDIVTLLDFFASTSYCPVHYAEVEDKSFANSAWVICQEQSARKRSKRRS